MADKILITGGSGFIGTNVMQFYIERGDHVLNIDIKSPQNSDHQEFWSETDILDYDKFESVVATFQPDYIIHLAARANLTGTTLEDYAVNTDGVENLIRIGNKINTVKKILFASTILVHNRGYVPESDTDYAPPNLYGESKAIGEELVRNKSVNYEWVIIRPTSIWGPWFGPTYRRFFEFIMKDRHVIFSGKMSSKTYGYVGNVVYQIDQILYSDSTHGNTYNLGDYEPTNIKDWAYEIASELDDKKVKSFPRSVVWMLAKIGDMLQFFNLKFPMSTFRFKNMTADAIKPVENTKHIAPNLRYSRIDGIRETIKWMKQHDPSIN